MNIQPITQTPTIHATLIAALTAAGGAHVAARFDHEGDTLTCAMLGREFVLIPELQAVINGPGPADSAIVYGTRARAGAVGSGAADVLAVTDDGRVYAGTQAFHTGAAPLCSLSDADPRSAIVAHLVATLPARQAR